MALSISYSKVLCPWTEVQAVFGGQGPATQKELPPEDRRLALETQRRYREEGMSVPGRKPSKGNGLIVCECVCVCACAYICL